MAALVRHLPMSFVLHRPVPLSVVVRRNRAANIDSKFVLVDPSANRHVVAAHSHCGRACSKNLLLALVELMSSPFATSLLKMMGHRRSSPNAAMVAKLEPPPRRFRRLE
jgi:hypothetical protein